MLRLHHATHESSAAKVLRMLCDLKKLNIQFVLMSVLYRFVAVSDRPLQCLCLCMSFFGSQALKTYKKQDSTKAHREAGAMTTLGSSKVEQMLPPGSMEHWPRASFR